MTQSEVRYRQAADALSKWGADLVRFAWSYLHNLHDAQDAVQDALLSYMKHAPEFETEAQEKAYLLTLTANRSRNMLVSGWFKSRNPIPEELPAENESRELLNAICALPRKYRQSVHLHYYEGYSIEETAKILGAKPATVGTWLARGREALKAQLGGLEDEE